MLLMYFIVARRSCPAESVVVATWIGVGDDSPYLGRACGIFMQEVIPVTVLVIDDTRHSAEFIRQFTTRKTFMHC